MRLLPVLAVAALAFGLRTYLAGAQSYWYDEGISVSLAARSLAQITRDALADIHPPVYYYALHFWIQVAGNGEFAVRFVSAASGALAAVAVYALGARLFSRLAGVAAALLVACAPVLVYYGQEARMYSLLLALTALWSLVLLHLLAAEGATVGDRKRGLWVAYVTLGLLCVYTHYFAFLLLGAHGIWVLANRATRPRALARWLMAMVLLPLAYLPWAVNMSWGQLSTFQQDQTALGNSDVIVRMLDDFTLGQRALPDEVVRLLFGSLLALGLLGAAIAGPRWRRGAVFSLLYLGVPMAGMLVLNAARAAYAARLVMLASPGFYLLLGAGVAFVPELARRRASGAVARGFASLVAAVALGAVALPLAGSLQGVYAGERWQRDDYRGAVRYFEANARGGDALVLDSPYQGDVVGLYKRGPQSQYPLPLGRPPDRMRTEAALTEITAKHGGVWVIFWGERETDPERVVEGWLDRNAYKALDRWFGGVRLAQYQVARVGERVPLDLRFGDSIRLRGYAWLKREGTPGDVLPLSLFWETTASLDKRYKVFVHLLDDREKIWGQRDSEPAGGASPTVSWRPGVEVEDRIGLPIDPGTAPGTYQVEIGMYEYPSMERPGIVDAAGRHVGNRVLVGPVSVK